MGSKPDWSTELVSGQLNRKLGLEKSFKKKKTAKLGPHCYSYSTKRPQSRLGLQMLARRKGDKRQQ